MSEQTTPPRGGELVNLETETPQVAKTSSIVPHNQSAQASGADQPQVERQNKEIHALIDSYMKNELEEGTVDREPGLPEAVVPENAIPFNGYEIFEELTDENGERLYKDKKWIGFPGHNAKESIPAYVEKIACAVDRYLKRGTHFVVRLTSRIELTFFQPRQRLEDGF